MIVEQYAFQIPRDTFEHLLKKNLLCFSKFTNVPFTSFISFSENLDIFKNDGVKGDTLFSVYIYTKCSTCSCIKCSSFSWISVCKISLYILSSLKLKIFIVILKKLKHLAKPSVLARKIGNWKTTFRIQLYKAKWP